MRQPHTEGWLAPLAGRRCAWSRPVASWTEVRLQPSGSDPPFLARAGLLATRSRPVGELRKLHGIEIATVTAAIGDVDRAGEPAVPAPDNGKPRNLYARYWLQ